MGAAGRWGQEGAAKPIAAAPAASTTMATTAEEWVAFIRLILPVKYACHPTGVKSIGIDNDTIRLNH